MTADIKIIHSKLQDLKKRYAKLRIDQALSRLSDTSQLRKVRRDIARQYTALTKATHVAKTVLAADKETPVPAAVKK